MKKEAQIEVCRRQESRLAGGERLAEVAPLLAGETEVFLVYDENVAWAAGEVLAACGSAIRGAIAIDTSEALKNLDTVTAICRQLLEAGASRKALLVAIGGGITTDMAGFAASLYKRGIRYANIPTSLLAQVDAAIGGKTGVNLDGYKNMLGAFHLPVFTFLCADVLRTLPPREFRSGLAELLKTFLIADAAAYAATIASVKTVLSADTQAKTAALSANNAQNADRQGQNAAMAIGLWALQAARIKAAIVQEDPFEDGRRAVLNLGHTFGHAIEHEAQRQGDDISHGEAVAMGILLAARLSEAVGVAENGLAAQLKADFDALGLPTESPYPLAALQEAMEKDKKAAGGKVKFVLLQAPGRVILQEMTAEQACKQLISK